MVLIFPGFELMASLPFPDENSVLCDESTGRVLDFNSFVETAGLEPGGRIMIM